MTENTTNPKTGSLGVCIDVNPILLDDKAYCAHVIRDLKRTLYERIGDLWAGDASPSVIYHGGVIQTEATGGMWREVSFSLSVVITRLQLLDVAVGEHLDRSQVPHWMDSRTYQYVDADGRIRVFQREVFTPTGARPVVTWKRTE